jgi:hypothetical protein
MTDDSLLDPEGPEEPRIEEIEELEPGAEDDAPGIEGPEHFGLTPPD